MSTLHYHSFAFMHASPGNPAITHASVYIGYPDRKISQPRIRAAKQLAGMHPDSVLLSVSYLGEMTPSEMDSHS